MRLELTQKLQQQQVLAPQMILSMDILLLPTLDLEQRIQDEFSENPALELVEQEQPAVKPEPAAGDPADFDACAATLDDMVGRLVDRLGSAC